jgi:DHA1 family tetracycline resistance protein-like MFS transporter
VDDSTLSADKKLLHWRQWVEPWYLTYFLQGAAVSGLIPILVPLVVDRTGSAAHIGFVVAAFNLGGLTAPVWGGIADRYRLHRLILAGGLLAATLGLAMFSVTDQLVLWIALAFVQGTGASGAATVANLFVVEVHPKSEWDERIGWLQTFYGGGQVLGLLLAGGLSQVNLRFGLLVAAGMTAVAMLWSWVTTREPEKPLKSRPILSQQFHHGEWVMISPQRLFHRLDLSALKQIKAGLRSPFGIFLLIWLVIFSGSTAVFSQYPVLMQKVFGVNPGISSAAFAVVVGLSLSFYAPAGLLADRFGPIRVMRAGLGARLVAFAGLLTLGITHITGQNWLAIAGFGIVVFAWTLLIVSGTTLSASLSPAGKGESLGMFNATNSLAGVAGAALGGWVANLWGYETALSLPVIGLVVGLWLSLFLRTRND